MFEVLVLLVYSAMSDETSLRPTLAVAVRAKELRKTALLVMSLFWLSAEHVSAKLP